MHHLSAMFMRLLGNRSVRQRPLASTAFEAEVLECRSLPSPVVSPVAADATTIPPPGSIGMPVTASAEPATLILAANARLPGPSLGMQPVVINGGQFVPSGLASPVDLNSAAPLLQPLGSIPAALVNPGTVLSNTTATAMSLPDSRLSPELADNIFQDRSWLWD